MSPPGGYSLSDLTPFATVKLIASLTDMLLQIAKPYQILLFGSAARREMSTASDLDLIVIVEANDEGVILYG